MVYAFGVTGNATRFLFDDLEETIIESPIPIESEHMLKILTGYSLVDQGTPDFYSHAQEVILHRGLDTLTTKQVCQACKDLKRATNLPKGAEFFHAAEKQLSKLIQ